MNKCKQCGEDTTNPKFCSRSCSATYNNIKKPRKKVTRICSNKDCNKLVKHSRTVLCELHLSEYKNNTKEEILNKTLKEYWERESVKGKHASWRNAGVRGLNRTWNKEMIKLPCANCGYNKHVELCHIKAIKDFDENALLKDVNAKENNTQLCRNCHWELDNGLLELSSIAR